MVDFARPSSSTRELKVRGVPDSTIRPSRALARSTAWLPVCVGVAMRSASKFYNMEPLFRQLRLL